MMCAVAVREITPGSYEGFRKAWYHDPWLPRYEKALVLRNEDSPDQVLTIAFFDGSRDELRGGARRSRDDGGGGAAAPPHRGVRAARAPERRLRARRGGAAAGVSGALGARPARSLSGSAACSGRPPRRGARPGGRRRSTRPAGRTARASRPAASPRACPCPGSRPAVPDGGFSSQTCSGSIRPGPAVAAIEARRALAAARAPAASPESSPSARPSYSPRSPASSGHRPARCCPARERAAVGRLAVAVVVVAVPELAARRDDAKLAVHDGKRAADVAVVGRLDAEPDQLEEARVDDAPLVDPRPAVADLVLGAGVRGGRRRSAAGSRACPRAGRCASASSPRPTAASGRATAR